MGRFTASHDPEHRPHELGTVLRWALWDRLTGRRRIAPPGPPAPAVEPDRTILDDPGVDHVTWLGHASCLGRLAGAGFLVDPVFSRRFPGFRRHGEPPLAPDALPPLDVVLVSHSHYDHFDKRSLRALDRDVEVVVPLALGSWFERQGFARVRELDWWESAEVGPLRITAVPARHWSRRTFWDTDDTLWCGWVVEGGGRSVYHAGDTAAFPGFADIGARFPGLDVALVPIGAYAPPWFMEHSHLNPEGAGRAFLDVGAEVLVPVHWGTFQLTDEPIAEPAARLRRWWDALPEETVGRRRLAMLAVGESTVIRRVIRRGSGPAG